MKLEPDKLKGVLGVREIEYAPAKGLALNDVTLA